MKSHFQKIFIVLAVLASIQTIGAVTFTITPSAVSNTYSGVITLQITGLSTGGSVIVRKYLDANSNGVVDAGDILWQEFQMTDGVASVFSTGTTSVTNFNVASDTDGSANGSITAKLYPAQDFAQLVVGKYLFVLLSSAGNVTNAFAVTNFPFAQSVSGNVVNNGTNVPNAVVFLFQPSPGGGQNPQGGVVADNSGAYKIAAAPGTYLIAAIKTNFVANLTVSPTVVLNQGSIITTNVPLTNATESISGSVVDASSGAGLAGYLAPMETSNLLAVAFTDTNGNFSAGVTKGHWTVDNNSDSLLVKGYLTFQDSINVDTTTGSVFGVTQSQTKESAIFYGKVEDVSGNPLTGADIESSDNNNLYQSDGVAFTNGNYVVSAVGGGGDQWQVQYDQRGPANYDYSQPAFDQNGGTNINVGQAIQVNITGLLATNYITGTVLFDGNPVSGVGINANATINNASYNAYADTGANGAFSLNVANGTWTVSVNCSGGSDSLESILGGNYQCPNNETILINNSNAVVNFTVQPAASDDQVFGYVSDYDGNPIAGVNVYADNGSGVTYTNTTDSTGYYSFFVSDGNWTISVDCSQLDSLGYSCVDSEPISVCCGNTYEADFTAQAPGNGFTYTIQGGQVTITGYTGPDGAVTIPATISGLPVTSIGDSAFFDDDITAVTIPDSVTNIGFLAFGECGELGSVSIPDSVTSLGGLVFDGCSSLAAINVDPSNANYSSLGGILFNKNQTTLIEFPAGSGASSYVIPDTVTAIGESAFSGIFDLTSISIPTGVTLIGGEAFQGCGLTSVTIPDSVSDIEGLAFQGCFRLASINVAGNNPNYASRDGVLFNKSQTVLIQYPEGDTATTYEIPAGVTIIEDGAFESCFSLTAC